MIVVLLLILLVAKAMAQSTPQPVSTSQSDLQATEVLDNVLVRASEIDQWLAGLEADLAQRATIEELTQFQQRLTQLEQQSADLSNVVNVDRSDARTDLATEVARLEAHIAGLSAALDDRITYQSQVAVDDTQGARQPRLAADTAQLAALHQLQDQSFWTSVYMTTCAILIVALLITGRILMEQRIQAVEDATLTSLSTGASATGRTASAGQPLIGAVSANLVAGKRAMRTEPARPVADAIPAPADQAAMIIREAHRFRHFRVKPQAAEGAWTLGLATAQGNVRSENQDYGLCFRIRGRDILLVADGMGGVPHGRKAAHAVVVSAAVSVIRAFGTAPAWYAPSVKDVAARAIMDAAHRLAVDGDKMNIAAIPDGLRTTLIVVIASRREVGYAYIGDGGGVVLSASGDIRRFLRPQKANDVANVLAASLGPVMEGEPVVGVMPRQAGDFVVVGTDGVFDRVADDFAKDVLRGAIENEGNVQATAEQVINELAAFKDSAGYVCDDNLTLGIMCDGSAPKLAQGFWSPANDVVDVLMPLAPAAPAPT
jgi:serine/threonine protein phosphatase PrpC